MLLLVATGISPDVIILHLILSNVNAVSDVVDGKSEGEMTGVWLGCGSVWVE